LKTDYSSEAFKENKHFTFTHGFFPAEAVEEFTENRWKSSLPQTQPLAKLK